MVDMLAEQTYSKPSLDSFESMGYWARVGNTKNDF